jgi:pyruvate dehydrogenase E1 component beta subunit
MKPAPCPTAKHLEDHFYPDVHDIVTSAGELVQKTKNRADFSAPPKQSMTDYYKHFKGPF